MSTDRLTDGEIACIDAVKTICEVLIARGLITPAEMAVPFQFQANGYLQKGMPAASAAMILLVNFLQDPQRNADRALLQTPPAGKA
jgi:hypothetical protein